MRQKHIILFFLLFLPSLSIYASREAVLFDGGGQSLENKLIAMTLAGIVNREEPRLYLLNVYETWSFNQTDETWRDLYENEGGVNFHYINNINTLVQHFRQDINGAITYDPGLTYGNFSGQNFRWQAEVAAMIGGLTDCIPLPYQNTSIDIHKPDSVWVADLFHHQSPLKISAKLEDATHPWNLGSLTQEERYFRILDWALETLLDRCNPGAFYLREITDWAISQRMFQLNLAGTHELQFSSLSDTKAQKLERVMGYLRDSRPNQVFHVYGWMRPEPLVQWISAWGGSFHETLLANLSWHHSFPADPTFDYQRPSLLKPEEVSLDNKYYVLFIASEGDASNWVAGFQGGAWLSPIRGEVPLGWGFNLHLFDQMPFLAQYYYRTATAQDGFVAVTNPLGYAYADMIPAAFLPHALEQANFLMEKYQIPTVYAYKHYNGAGISSYRGITISNNYNFIKLGDFAQKTQTQLTFLFDPALQTQRLYTQYGGLLYNHVNDETFYADVRDLDQVAQRIKNKLQTKPKPTFLLAGYQRFRHDHILVGDNNRADMTLPRLKSLMEKLKNDPDVGPYIEFVTPEKFALLQMKNLQVNTSLAMQEAASTLQVWIDNGQLLKLSNGQIPAGESLVQIFDTTGRLILQQSIHQHAQGEDIHIPLQTLSRGMFLVRISSEGFSLGGKFMVP